MPCSSYGFPRPSCGSRGFYPHDDCRRHAELGHGPEKLCSEMGPGGACDMFGTWLGGLAIVTMSLYVV